MKYFPLLALLVLSATLMACATRKSLKTVSSVDLERYSGKWYEVASFPAWFQRRCACCTTAEYTPQPDGSIRVVNSCKAKDGEPVVAEGRATVVPDSGNARLRVRFRGSPVAGDYQIIGLDTAGYQWAVVGHPSRKYLWFLSRTPEVSEAVFEKMREAALANHYDLGKLEKTSH